MVVLERRTAPGVRADINYVRNRPATPAETLQFVTEHEERNTMQTLPGQPMWISDARSLTTELDREGFVLVSHESQVDDFDLIQEDPAVDGLYVRELTELLSRVTGASLVVLTGGGKKRYGESATEKWGALPNSKPARYPHADNTDVSAKEGVEMFAQFVDGIDLDRFARYAMYNLWRAVSPPPQDVPLAVCDARTVAPDDEVTVTAVTLEKGAGEIVHDTTGYQFNPAHRWHYFPNMTRDEVIIFKAHDTDPNRAGRVPHTAFTDPTCPPGTPTRASVEARAIAFFE